jgi:phage terminase large subunit-like protein
MLDHLAAELGEGAAGAMESWLESLTVTELAAIWYDWEGTWARPKQVLPTGRWRSFGLLTGRGFGKSRTFSEYVQKRVREGRSSRIALIAQNEDKTIEVMVEGKSGLLATSPPWFKARFEKNRVIWPNGAQAFIYTPESPGGLRGPEHDLAWASEFVAWPAATADEAFSNLRLGLRIGEAQLVWDTTPKRKHKIIRWLLKRAERHPEHHIVRRGSTRENMSNLPAEQVREWYDEYGGTQRGREELEGEFFDDADGAAWKQAWIDAHRRELPVRPARSILSVDPAISTKRGTDRTGIVDLSLGEDGQVYVVADLSGKHAPQAWAELVIRRYFDRRCDCVVVERDRGGDLVASQLKAWAMQQGVDVVVVDKRANTRHEPRTIYVKETKASQSKQDRHTPVATLYERGRVSHVSGATLANLEDWLTTWEPTPGAKSPDSIDALVQGVRELAGIDERGLDLSKGFDGIAAVAAKLATDRSVPGGVAELLGRAEWGDSL